ncbi:MAG: DUF2283 domain-containing protein [Candidatus Omnitrophica bacterium]|nr:DUF2283 domain-containing protein [Candidatus Omnitrophota bacterium]
MTYDPRYNIAYLRFQKKARGVESVKLSETLVVDVAPDGTVYGIELLNANKQLRGPEARRFVVTNEATGKTADVTLP